MSSNESSLFGNQESKTAEKPSAQPAMSDAQLLAKTKHPEELKASVAAINVMVTEATFDASGDGIAFRGMDASHIGLIDFFWPAAAFEDFVCNSPIKFGVKVEDFGKLLKRVDKKDSIALELGSDSMLQVNTLGQYKRNYKLKLIEAAASSTPLPKLSYNTKAVMPIALFDKLLGDIEVVSEYVAFEAEGKQLIMKGHGDEGEARTELGEDKSLGLEELVIKEQSNSAYSLDYIVKFVKALLPLGGSVTVEFSTKMPIRLEFKIANMGRVHFYLAPRVDQ